MTLKDLNACKALQESTVDSELLLDYAESNPQLYMSQSCGLCRLLPSKWSKRLILIQKMTPSCFMAIDQRLAEFDWSNLRFLQPQIFSRFNERDLLFLRQNVDRLNDLSDEQFLCIPNTIVKSIFSSVYTLSEFSEKKTEKLLFSRKVDFADDLIENETNNSLFSSLIDHSGFARSTGLFLADNILREMVNESGNSMEGGHIVESAFYLAKLMKLSFLNNESLQLAAIENIWLKLMSMEMFKSEFFNAENFENKVLAYLKHMLIDDYILIPYGFVKHSGGHAVLMEVARVDSTYYRITLYNSGDGIESYHASKRFDSKLKYILYWKTKKISFKQMEDTKFFRAVKAVRHLPPGDNFNSSDPYKIVMNRFEIEPYTGVEDEDLFLTVQYSGTCAMSSIISFIRYKTSKSVFKLLKYEITKYALQALLKYGKINPESKLILHFGIRFAKNLARLAEEYGKIEDLDEISLLVAGFSKFEQEARKKRPLVTEERVKDTRFVRRGILFEQASHIIQSSVDQQKSLSVSKIMGTFESNNFAISERIESVEDLENLSTLLLAFSAKNGLSDSIEAYAANLLVHISLDLKVDDVDTFFNNLRNVISILFRSKLSKDKEIDESLFVAFFKVLGITWNLFLRDNESSEVQVSVKKLGVKYLFHPPEKFLHVHMSPKLFKNYEEVYNLFFMDEPDTLGNSDEFIDCLFIAPFGFHQFIDEVSPSHRDYLNALLDADGRYLEEVRSLKRQFQLVDELSLSASFAFCKDEILPNNYKFLRDFFYLIRVAQNISSYDLPSVEILLKLFQSSKPMFKLGKQPLLVGNEYSLFVTDVNDSKSFGSTNAFGRRKQASHCNLTIKSSERLFKFAPLCDSSNIWPGFVSLFRFSDLLGLKNFLDMKILHTGFSSLDSAHHLKILDSDYYRVIIDTFNHMIKNIEITLYKTFVSYHEVLNDEDDVSCFEQYVFLTGEKIKFLNLLEESKNSKELHMTRLKLTENMKYFEKSDNAVIYFASLKILSYETISLDAKQAIDFLSAVFTLKRSIASSFSNFKLLFNLESHILNIIHHKRKSIFSYWHSRDFCTQIFHNIFNMPEIDESFKFEFKNAKLYCYNESKLYMINFFYGDAFEDQSPLWLPSHLLSNPNLKKLLGNDHSDLKIVLDMSNHINYTLKRGDFTLLIPAHDCHEINIISENVKCRLTDFSDFPFSDKFQWYCGDFALVTTFNLNFFMKIYPDGQITLPDDKNLKWTPYEPKDSIYFPGNLDCNSYYYKSTSQEKEKIVYYTLLDDMGNLLEFESRLVGDSLQKVWIQEPEFFIESSQINVDFPTGFNAFLPLTNLDKSKQFYLVPIKTRKIFSSSNFGQMSRKYEYFKIPAEDWKIKTKDTKHLFYLAYLFMSYYEYELAWKFLNQIIHVDPFSDDEIRFAVWIITYSEAERQFYSELFALASYTSYLIFMNSRNFPDFYTVKDSAKKSIKNFFEDPMEFRNFLNGEIILQLGDMTAELTFSQVLGIHIRRYYEIFPNIPYGMIFHNQKGGNFRLGIPYENEIDWLQWSGDLSTPRLEMLMNRSADFIFPYPPDFSIDEKLFQYLGRVKFEPDNEEKKKSLMELLYNPRFSYEILKPSFEFLSEYTLIQFIREANPEELKLLKIYVSDASPSHQVSRAILQMLYIIILSREKSENCKEYAIVFLKSIMSKDLSHTHEEIKNLIEICSLPLSKEKIQKKNSMPVVPTPVISLIESNARVRTDLRNGLEAEHIVFQMRTKALLTEMVEFKEILNLIKASKQSLELLNAKSQEKIQSIICDSSLELMMIGDSWLAPLISDLIPAFIHADLALYKVLLPHASEGSIEIVHNELLRYFSSSFYVMQLDLLLENSQLSKAEEIKTLIGAIKRAYLCCDNSSCLPCHNGKLDVLFSLIVFEYHFGNFIRESHIPDIYLLSDDTSNKQYILQRIMSGGKTFVLGTVLSVVRADGTKLSVLIVPNALLSLNARDMFSRTRQFFGIDGFLFHFGRGKEFTTPKNLAWLLNALKLCIMKRQYVVTSIESLQSLRNAFIELLSNENIADRFDSIKIMKEILRIFKEHAYALIDEIDWTLDPLTLLNFPVSEKSLIDQKILSILGEIFVESSANSTINSILQLTNENAMAVSLEDYNRALPGLTEIAIQCTLKHLSNRVEGPMLKNVFMMNLVEIKTVLAESTLGLEGEDLEIFLNIHLFIRSHLPEALEKKVNEHYGLSKKQYEKIKYAKPYLAANTPSESSDFSDTIVLLTKTFRTYFQVKLARNELKEMIIMCQDEAISEKFESEGPVDETKIAKEFSECFEVENLFKLNLEDGILMSLIASKQDKVCALKFMVKYLNKFVNSKLGQYPKEVSSSASNAVSMMRKVDGYSGSIDNVNIFPLNRLKSQTETSEQVQYIIDKDDTIYERIYEKLSMNPKLYQFEGLGLMALDVLQQLEKAIPKETISNVSAILDIGAYFRRYLNSQIAESILNWKKDIEAVIFYEESTDNLLFMKRNSAAKKLPGSNSSVIQTATGLRLDQIFLFLDQRHCVGTDVQLMNDAVGIATFSESVTLRGIYQGVMRMRMLVNGNQSIFFAGPTELFHKLVCSEGKKLFDFECLMNLAKKNSEKIMAIQNSKTFMQSLEDSLTSEILHQIIYHDYPFELFSNILIKEIPLSQTDKLSLKSIPIYNADFLSNLNEDQKAALKDKFSDLIERSKILDESYRAFKNFTEHVGQNLQEQKEEQQEEQEEEEEEEELVSSLDPSDHSLFVTAFPETVKSIEDALLLELTSLKQIPTLDDYGFHVWNLQDLCEISSELSQFKRLYPRNVYVTRNFASFTKHQLDLFKLRRFFAYQLLIIQSSDSDYKVILISPQDIASIHNVMMMLKFENMAYWLTDIFGNLFFASMEKMDLPNLDLKKILIPIIISFGSVFSLESAELRDVMIEYLHGDDYLKRLLIETSLSETERSIYERSRLRRFFGDNEQETLTNRIIRGNLCLARGQFKFARSFFSDLTFDHEKFSDTDWDLVFATQLSLLSSPRFKWTVDFQRRFYHFLALNIPTNSLFIQALARSMPIITNSPEFYEYLAFLVEFHGNEFINFFSVLLGKMKENTTYKSLFVEIIARLAEISRPGFNEKLKISLKTTFRLCKFNWCKIIRLRLKNRLSGIMTSPSQLLDELISDSE